MFPKYHMKSSHSTEHCALEKQTPAVAKATGIRLPSDAWGRLACHIPRHRVSKVPCCVRIWCFARVVHGTVGLLWSSKTWPSGCEISSGQQLVKESSLVTLLSLLLDRVINPHLLINRSGSPFFSLVSYRTRSFPKRKGRKAEKRSPVTWTLVIWHPGFSDMSM